MEGECLVNDSNGKPPHVTKGMLSFPGVFLTWDEYTYIYIYDLCLHIYIYIYIFIYFFQDPGNFILMKVKDISEVFMLLGNIEQLVLFNS